MPEGSVRALPLLAASVVFLAAFVIRTGASSSFSPLAAFFGPLVPATFVLVPVGVFLFAAGYGAGPKGAAVLAAVAGVAYAAWMLI